MGIYRKVLSEKIRQHVALGIFRSDYMLHNVESDSRELMQVELNTISSSFGSLSTKVSTVLLHSLDFNGLYRSLECIDYSSQI